MIEEDDEFKRWIEAAKMRRPVARDRLDGFRELDLGEPFAEDKMVLQIEQKMEP